VAEDGHGLSDLACGQVAGCCSGRFINE